MSDVVAGIARERYLRKMQAWQAARQEIEAEAWAKQAAQTASALQQQAAAMARAYSDPAFCGGRIWCGGPLLVPASAQQKIEPYDYFADMQNANEPVPDDPQPSVPPPPPPPPPPAAKPALPARALAHDRQRIGLLTRG